MLVGLLSDAHGNPWGFEKCLDALLGQGAEQIYFLGDAIGYLPYGLEVLSQLVSQPILCTLGNHEAMALGILASPEDKKAVYRLDLIKDRFQIEFGRVIKNNWPKQREVVLGQRKLFMSHGQPNDPLSGYLYEDQEISFPELKGFDAIFFAHTHRPFSKQISRDQMVVNVGSCGLPRDTYDLASCVLYNTQDNSAEIIKVKLDLDHLLTQCTPDQVDAQITDRWRKSMGLA